ncbi:hypothetical protein FPZ43_01970 [Mucilaginibacter pallidiroseus]|uniref:Tail specific protease domain-containing protein n=1 Tax=Mucilaginibacter pallidiroseus TaxID=2599295 RepID=A0A563UIS7_9SPHI|nr:S41 family peptidase [Mucilaginibacter pallidiroseus]TWR31267.1 hypothetical protein FPZ43_01970 [Mucilaginibacter pallidiroseus]
MKFKYTLLSFIILLLPLGVMAQDVSAYQEDVKSLYGIVKQLPSYKAQITGDTEIAYHKLYEHLLVEKPVSDFDYFIKLTRLMEPIKDNHAYLSQVAKTVITQAQLADTAFIKVYKASPEFRNYPSSRVNLDKLTSVLKAKPVSDVEGIYYYGQRYLTIGVYRTAKKDSLVGVVLGSRLPHWQPGQIAIVLKEYQLNRFRCYAAQIGGKAFGFLRNEKFMHGNLTETRYRKNPEAVDYVNISDDLPKFHFKSLSGGIKYMRLGSFSSNEKNVAFAQQFYDMVKDSLSANKVIVDLRNNGGGGYKASGNFITMLQKFAMNAGHIYIIVNNRTMSDAERFTIRLRGFDNVKVLGENTNGTIAYGNNTGRSDTLQSRRYMLYITDMPDQRMYVNYEDIGFKPDVLLSPKRDWIEQTLELIAKQ